MQDMSVRFRKYTCVDRIAGYLTCLLVGRHSWAYVNNIKSTYDHMPKSVRICIHCMIQEGLFGEGTRQKWVQYVPYWDIEAKRKRRALVQRILLGIVLSGLAFTCGFVWGHWRK